MPELTNEETQLLQQLSERERVVSGPHRPRSIQRLVDLATSAKSASIFRTYGSP
jgi:hypothetical protein